MVQSNQSPLTEPDSLPHATPPDSRRAHPYRAFIIRAGLGVAVVAALLWHYDARPVFRILSRERPACFAITVVLYLGGQVLCAYRWQQLAEILKIRGRFPEFVAFTFVGMFTNLFVPGLLAGDAAEWARG